MSTISAGVVTVAGGTLLARSQITGASIAVSGVRITGDAMDCTGDETALTGTVTTIPISALTATPLGNGRARYSLYLGLALGTFDIGTVGLFVGSTLFALAAFPGAGTKIAADPPLTTGNIRHLLVDVAFPGGHLSYAPGPIVGAALAASILADSTRTITVRQLRTALAQGVSGIGLAPGRNAALASALGALGPDDPVAIQWTGFLVTLGDPLAAFVRGHLALSDVQMGLLFTAASALPA